MRMGPVDIHRVAEVMINGKWFKVGNHSFQMNVDLGYPPGGIANGFFFNEKGSGNGLYGSMHSIQMIRCK